MQRQAGRHLGIGQRAVVWPVLTPAAEIASLWLPSASATRRRDSSSEQAKSRLDGASLGPARRPRTWLLERRVAGVHSQRRTSPMNSAVGRSPAPPAALRHRGVADAGELFDEGRHPGTGIHQALVARRCAARIPIMGHARFPGRSRVLGFGDMPVVSKSIAAMRSGIPVVLSSSLGSAPTGTKWSAARSGMRGEAPRRHTRCRPPHGGRRRRNCSSKSKSPSPRPAPPRPPPRRHPSHPGRCPHPSRPGRAVAALDMGLSSTSNPRLRRICWNWRVWRHHGRWHRRATDDDLALRGHLAPQLGIVEWQPWAHARCKRFHIGEQGDLLHGAAWSNKGAGMA